MEKKKICFIAQFPPPIHGLSKAVETLYISDLKHKYEFEKIDIKNNKAFISNIIALLRSKADLFYFTISQSKYGNLRDLIIMKLLSIRHKKCLIHLHGGHYRTLVDTVLPKWQRNANYKAISKITGAVVLSPRLRQIFKGMLPEGKIFTVPNCVDDEYLMDDKTFEVKISNQKNKVIKDVLYLSNFIKSKGYLEVLELARIEKENVESGKERRFMFHFAGGFFSKEDQLIFKRYIENNKLKDYVIYHGIVAGQSKKDLLNQCDIFILLTSYSNEGQPISILEAMGNGMMIVTTNHAGIPDIVKDGINGIVVAKDKLDLYSVYSDIKNASLCFSITNRNEVLNNYCESNYLRNMESVFGICVDES